MSKPNPHCDAEQGETRVSFSLLYIPAVIALMSVGYGFQQSVTGELVEMADLIMVLPRKASYLYTLTYLKVR